MSESLRIYCCNTLVFKKLSIFLHVLLSGKKNCTVEKKSNRLISLDLFRGITIAGMILVNNPGSWESVYLPFLHADWDGATPTDMIFPFFLYIVGVSVVLAYSRQLEKISSPNVLLRKIIKRVFILFLLGLILNGFPQFDLSSIRIPGVLQRIAIVFFFCALLYLYTSWKKQVYVGGGLLIVYWIIMTAVETPGVGEVTLSKGENIAAWLDSIVLKGHMWGVTKTWDPEGFLSTLPAISTGISGMLVGHFLLTKKAINEKLIWLFVAGCFSILLGLFWGLHFPINKSLWSSSYVLYTSGIATLCFAICYWFVDVLGYKKWTNPFIIYGSNAITVYFANGIFATLLYYFNFSWNGESVCLQDLFFKFFASGLPPKLASLICALINVWLFYGLALIMYRKKIFIKV